MTRVVAYTPDLMDRSKIAAAAEGGNVSFVSSPAALASAEADLFVVDLTRAGVLDVLPTLTGRVVGYANHVERGLMEQAAAAGCHQVMARSAFFARIPELLSL